MPFPTDNVPECASAVVCLHGLRRPASDWDGVREGLEPFGPVRAPVLPSRPREALEQVKAELTPGAVVIGHSMGAVLALQAIQATSVALRALVLTGSFYPPARNGRSLAESARDYAAHRVAYVRELGGQAGGDASRAGGAQALGSLVRLAARRSTFHAAADTVRCPVLVVHGADDHHVPVNFALAAAARHPDWTVRVLEGAGHHAHVDQPSEWLGVVAGWLDQAVAS